MGGFFLQCGYAHLVSQMAYNVCYGWQHVYIYTDQYVYIYILINTYIYIYTDQYVYIYILINTYIYIYTDQYVYIYIYTDQYVYIYIYTDQYVIYCATMFKIKGCEHVMCIGVLLQNVFH